MNTQLCEQGDHSICTHQYKGQGRNCSGSTFRCDCLCHQSPLAEDLEIARLAKAAYQQGGLDARTKLGRYIASVIKP